MRASLGWLNEFVSTGLSAQETARALTMSGLEVEGIEEESGDALLDVITRPKDTLFEVNVTPNRADCLSILGIARELSALTGAPVKMPPSKVTDMEECGINIEIADPGLCSRYAGRVIKGVKTGLSPDWMKRRLEASGIRSINNVVDITNYVLLELGHPLHAFDLAKLRGGKIIVDTAANRGGQIKTLDGVERKDLPEDTLLICDGAGPVAIAGVMGGADTEVSEATTDIFLESAWFEPRSIRRTSKRLGLSSESSYRFERGADVEMVATALNRASYLMKEIAGGAPSGMADNYPRPFRPHMISIGVNSVNRHLGTWIPRAEMVEILRKLNLHPEADGDTVVVMPPSYRLDIETEIDIVEEIARIYGYGEIPSTLPCASMSSEGLSPKQKFLREVKAAMASAGYNEAINFSFMNIKSLATLGISEGDARWRAAKIMNPLREEDAHMRTSLVPALLENLRRNFTRGVRDIRLFETSRVFFAEEHGGLPAEPARLGGVFFRQKSYLFWKEPEGDFYGVKGALEGLFEHFRIEGVSLGPCAEPFLHPGKSADIFLSGKRAGFAGVVLPAIKESFEVKAKEDVVVFELDLDLIFESLPPAPRYRALPKYPYIERDIAVVVDEVVKAADILKEIRSYPSPLVEDASVFDLYKGDKVEKGKKSLAFNIRYRAKDRTLTEEELEPVHRTLVEHVLKATGGRLRE